MDIQMPGMNGYEVAKQIRNFKSTTNDQQPATRNLPLIALSSVVGRDAKRCEKAGFDGFLSKPIRREKLYQMLERVIGTQSKEHIRIESHQDGSKSDIPCTDPAYQNTVLENRVMTSNRSKGILESGQVRASRNPIVTQYSVREEMKHSVSILLAEDNLVNQKLAKITLTKAGYRVEVANNGEEAVEKYTKSPDDFDLVFMDVQMLKMDGMNATKAIRKWERLKDDADDKGKMTNDESIATHVPIVAMTANAQIGFKEKCLESGMDEYITKPIKRELVFEILDKFILKRRYPES
jgi:CheY-like chemotaxis protein